MNRPRSKLQFFKVQFPRHVDTTKTIPNIDVCPDCLVAMLDYWYISVVGYCPQLKKRRCYWSQTSVEMDLSGRCTHSLFHSRETKKWSRDDEFMTECISESLPSGKLHHSLFVSLLSFTLFSKIESKICYREKFTLSKTRSFVLFIATLIKNGCFAA